MARLYQLARLVHEELHAIELTQQVVGEFDVGLVDFVDEQHRLHARLEGLPQAALHDVVADVVHFLFAELRVAQARDGVVFVQAVMSLAGGFDVPLVQRPLQRLGDFRRELGLACAGLALDEQRAAEGHGGIHCHHEIGRCDVAFGAGEAGLGHARELMPCRVAVATTRRALEDSQSFNSNFTMNFSEPTCWLVFPNVVFRATCSAASAKPNSGSAGCTFNTRASTNCPSTSTSTSTMA